MCNLHTPVRRPSETWEDYKARQAASACLRKKHAAELMERHILRAHITIVDEINQLLDEQEEYDATRHNPIDTDRRNRHSSDGNKSDDLRRGKEMRRREHYVEWLSTQNVLDSMRLVVVGHCFAWQVTRPICKFLFEAFRSEMTLAIIRAFSIVCQSAI